MFSLTKQVRPRFVVWLVVIFLLVTIANGLMKLVLENTGSEMQARAETEIIVIATALESFHAAYDHYPTNSNTIGVLASLGGNNSSKLSFISYKHASSNDLSYVDPWGTPYSIQPVNQTNFTITSAGRGKKFGDSDDWVYDLRKSVFLQRSSE